MRLLQLEGRKTATLGTQTGVGAALAEGLPSGTQPRPRGSILLAPATATTRETETVSYQLSHSGQCGEAAFESNLEVSPPRHPNSPSPCHSGHSWEHGRQRSLASCLSAQSPGIAGKLFPVKLPPQTPSRPPWGSCVCTCPGTHLSTHSSL